MILRDLHTHTIFCDGKNTPEEMVLSAISKGLETIGFSAHSYTFFDESYCLQKNKINEYRSEVSHLKEKYKDKINVLCGIEKDYYSLMETDEFDYVIGSVHYLKLKDEYVPIDENEEIFVRLATKYFCGDFYALAEEYYSLVGDIISKTKIDIIGHFDLVSKFNEGGKFFDEKHPRYIKAYKSAVDKLIPFNIPFEVNLSGVLNGYKKAPYPNQQILEYILKKGGKVLLSSDSHSKDSICSEFEKWAEIIQKLSKENI